MPAQTVRFAQVDVFTAVPFKGNPLAVVFDADTLTTDQMQQIARWTNLSETAFLLAPTDPAADYRVRIFTPGAELPFAGHPTLGSAHAVRESGYQPKQPGRLVQQCAAGLIELTARGERVWAFAAPPARVTPLPAERYAELSAALRIDVAQAVETTGEPPFAVDNGAPWLVVRLPSPEACLAVNADPAALGPVTRAAGTHGVALYAPHPAGGPATFEVRCLMSGGGFGVGEDPVTGSANAAIAQLLSLRQKQPGRSYTARQGTALGRDGRIYVDYDQASAPQGGGKTWIGGESFTVIEGTFRLP